jgi:hypothetical protein
MLPLLIAASLVGAEMPADFTLPEPPGRYVDKAADEAVAAGFRSGSPLVATTYFYWYDAPKAHVIDADGSDALTDHPPTLEGFSYKNVDWHAHQLEDMIAAGIDAALPVYWGTPVEAGGWSNRGLPPLVAARERLLAEGKRPPAIGLFYDTSTLRHNPPGWHVDLTTEAGRTWFYGTIRDFFSLVPPEHRATVDGRPLVFLYASAFARDVDAALFPAVRRMFRRDFGSDLFLVKMRGWPGEADSEYQWGAALGPKLLDTAGLGPGYDHSAVPGRAPLVRERDGGRFYEFGWQRLLMKDPRTRPWLVHLETWNEFHEGTEICETAEYGREYIELTRRFADLFHAGRRLDPAEIGPSRPLVEATPERSAGLSLVPMPDGDGPVVEKLVSGREAWSTVPNRFSPMSRYLYFEVEDYFLYDGDEPVEVKVQYWDAGPGSFRIDYDSSDPALGGTAQQFRSGGTQAIAESGTWKEAAFVLPHARFAGRANGADFRLAAIGGDLVVAVVVVRRK